MFAVKNKAQVYYCCNNVRPPPEQDDTGRMPHTTKQKKEKNIGCALLKIKL